MALKSLDLLAERVGIIVQIIKIQLATRAPAMPDGGDSADDVIQLLLRECDAGGRGLIRGASKAQLRL